MIALYELLLLRLAFVAPRAVHWNVPTSVPNCAKLESESQTTIKKVDTIVGLNWTRDGESDDQSNGKIDR
jgi:hypothetical protein